MSRNIRKLLTENIIKAVKKGPNIGNLNRLSSILELRRNDVHTELHLLVQDVKNIFQQTNTNFIQNILSMKFNDKIIKDISLDDQSRHPKIIFKLKQECFIENILSCSNSDAVSEVPEKIVVEFSSPNIAKPFHVGHLRSTIIGNFVSNLFTYLNNNVIKINYLGDWGTQFGYLKLGMDASNYSDEEIQKNPIMHLFNAYVKAHKLSETDPGIHEKARSIFHELENGTFAQTDKWNLYRDYTIIELKSIYERLGVKFDIYNWESMYSRDKIHHVMRLLRESGLLVNENEGHTVVKLGDRKIPVMKNDGTTLYFTRDIAAIIHRFEEHKFNKMYYVVDNDQADHFNTLFGIAKASKLPGANGLNHIKFGRIKGMSTRKGNVVFLRDILDEAKSIMLQKQIESATTKIDLTNSDDKTADILGISAVIINDLKQRRQRDYDFDWTKVLQSSGDTGIKLQYTHCRLCSLQLNSYTEQSIICIPSLLQETEALQLIYEIGKFEEILYKSEESLESCILVNYLFGLCNAISRALKKLNIKHEKSDEIRSQRILLFRSAHRVLNTGMNILGLQPLEKM